MSQMITSLHLEIDEVRDSSKVPTELHKILQTEVFVEHYFLGVFFLFFLFDNS